MKQTTETVRQALDFLKWACAPGGVVLLVVSQLGLSSNPQVNHWIEVVGGVVGAILTAWSAFDQYKASKDTSIVKAASEIPGTTVHVDPLAAPAAVVATANDPAVADVVIKSP